MPKKGFTKKQLQEKKDALRRARNLKTRFVRAVKDKDTKITDGQKALLVRMVALEILKARRVTAFSLADLA